MAIPAIPKLAERADCAFQNFTRESVLIAAHICAEDNVSSAGAVRFLPSCDLHHRMADSLFSGITIAMQRRTICSCGSPTGEP